MKTINNQQSTINNLSFTFIETLVVISVIGLIFPVVISILFVILQQQMKIFRLSEVKRQGDNIVTVLENAVKNNAYTIYYGLTEICEADNTSPFPHSGSPSSFRDKYNSEFSINYSTPNLSISYPPPPVPAPTFSFAQGQLNSSKVIVDSYSISCTRAEIYSEPVVSVSFTICYNVNGSCTSSRPEETAALDYQTSIKLRSFPTQ